MTQTQEVVDLTTIEVPTPSTWVFDPTHTEIGIVARHLMVTKVRGRFSEFTGTIHLAEVPEESWAEVVVRADSIDTKTPDRDAHLRSADFLDAEVYPEIRFRSTNVERTSESVFRLHGDLTIKDITKPVVLDGTFEGLVADPWGNQRIAFSISGEIDREAWGLNWNVALEKGGWLVSKKFQLEAEVEAVLQTG